MGLRSHHPCRGHQPATASRELIVNKRGWTPSENIEHSMDAIPAPSFGTRRSQVRDGTLYRERNRPLSAPESFIGNQNDTADNDQNYSCKFREGELFTEQKSDNHSGCNSPSNTDGSAN